MREEDHYSEGPASGSIKRRHKVHHRDGHCKKSGEYEASTSSKHRQHRSKSSQVRDRDRDDDNSLCTIF